MSHRWLNFRNLWAQSQATTIEKSPETREFPKLQAEKSQSKLGFFIL